MKMPRKSAPAKTAKARENQLISLAADLAEKKLREGTASSQIICTLLNFASMKYKLEMEKLKSDISLAEAKKENMKNADGIMELYSDALNAFKSYKGSNEEEIDEEHKED